MSGWHGQRRPRTYEIGQCSKMVLAIAVEIIARDIFSRDRRHGEAIYTDPDNPDLQEYARRILFHAEGGMQRAMRDEALLFAHGCVKVLKEQFKIEEVGIPPLPQHKRER